MHDDARALADQLCARVVTALSDPPVSVVLHGSLVLGDFRPGLSDVDLLVVVEDALTTGQIDGLTAAVAGCRGNADLRAITHTVAAMPTRAPALELYVGRHSDDWLEVETRMPEPDLVTELSMCRSFGRPLVGAEPRAVIGPVPDRWVIDYGDELLAGWQELIDDADHAELMVLTACRIWRFAHEGGYSSKTDAGAWALERDPALAAIPPALRQRAGDEAEIAPGDIAELLARVRREIAATLSRP